jgi:signal peptidase I
MDDNNPFLEKEVSKKKGNIFIDILQSVAIAVSLSIFLYLIIITPNEVDGPSMLPNFETGDLLFTSKIHKFLVGTDVGDKLGINYSRGDVVVFQKPGFDDFVKRVIATPGENIRIENGVYYVNGDKLEEYYELNNEQQKDGSFLQDGDDPITLGEDEYFLSGDNRNVSFDSRELGPIKIEWIKGKVIFRFWPLDKLGVIGAGKSELVEE